MRRLLLLPLLLGCDAATAGHIASVHALALSPAPAPCIAAARAEGKCEWRVSRTSVLGATADSVYVRWTTDGAPVEYEARQFERDGRVWRLVREW